MFRYVILNILIRIIILPQIFGIPLLDVICRDNNVKGLKILMELCDYDIDDVLEYALKWFWRENIVENLLEMGADPNKSVKNGLERPMHQAIRSCSVKGALALLKKGIDVNEKFRHATSYLHLAIKYKYVEMVELLLSRGADVELTDGGNTPLMASLAVIGDNEEIVKALLNANADVNAVDEDGNTCSHLAARPRPLASNAEDDGVAFSLMLNSKKIRDLNARNGQGETPLIVAAKYRNKNVFLALLAAGVSVDARDNSGKTALHYLCECDAYENTALMVLNLVRNNAHVDVPDANGNTPLLVACMNNIRRSGIAHLLMKAGADVNSVNSEGLTSAFYAVEHNDAKLLEWLLFYGANISVNTYSFNTLSKKEFRPITNILIETGVRFSPSDWMVLLKKMWPYCYKIVEIARFRNFDGMVSRVTDSLVRKPFVINLISKVELYEQREMFALYKILKGVYIKKEPILALESSKTEIFYQILNEITVGTYLQSLPLDLVADIFLRNNFYKWKFENLAWNFALACHKLKVSVNGGTLKAFATPSYYFRNICDALHSSSATNTANNSYTRGLLM